MPIQKPGTYHLTETKAPAGFNLLTMSIVISVASDATVTATLGSLPLREVILTGADADNYQVAFHIANKQAAELPRAGGIGTVLITLISAAVLLTATVLLKKRRRGFARGV